MKDLKFEGTDKALEDNLRIIQAAIKALESVSGGNRIPTGTIAMTAKSAADDGYLLCDGAAISRTAYATLFAVIGVIFGGGDGTYTFNLPDFRGIFPKGAGQTTRPAGVDAAGNPYVGAFGQYEQDVMQGHKHSTDSNFTRWAGGPNPGPAGGTWTMINMTPTGTPVDDGSGNGTPRTGTKTQSACLCVNFQIKT